MYNLQKTDFAVWADFVCIHPFKYILPVYSGLTIGVFSLPILFSFYNIPVQFSFTINKNTKDLIVCFEFRKNRIKLQPYTT